MMSKAHSRWLAEEADRTQVARIRLAMVEAEKRWSRAKIGGKPASDEQVQKACETAREVAVIAEIWAVRNGIVQ